MDLATWQPFIDWLHLNPHWVGLITCIVALTESLVVVGLIVPGAVMMVAIGTLVGAHVIPFTSTMLYGVLGAILGDGMSYWVGHHYHEHIREMWPFRKYPQWLTKGETFFAAHGAKSVFMGRFVGPVRPLVPVIAGMLNMSPLRFYTANFISAFIWSPAYMLPGIILGQASREFGPEIATHFLLVVLGVLIAVAVSAWLVKLIYLGLLRCCNHGLSRSWTSVKKRYPNSWIDRWCTTDHLSQQHYLFALLLWISFCVLCFIAVSFSALQQGWITQWNDPVFYLLRSLRNHTWDQVMVTVTLLGNSKTILPLWFMVAAGFTVRKQWRLCGYWMLIAALAGISLLLLKNGFYSARPGHIVHVRLTSSFPSAHTTLGTLFYGLVAMWMGMQCRSIYVRHAIAATALTLISLIAFSRLYLGAHWLSDIIAALLLASIFIFLGAFLLLRTKNVKLSIPTLSVCILLGLCCIYPIQFHNKYHHYLYSYTPFWPSYTMTTDAWWKDDGRPLAIYLYSRTGKPLAPFNLQWLGDLETIKTHLIKKGWQIPPKMNLKKSIGQINKHNEITYQPFFSKLYQNQKPSLILVKYFDEQQIPLMLQLWQAKMVFTDNSLPLWIGTLHDTPPQKLFKRTYPVTNVLDQQQSPVIDHLTADLTPWDWKKIARLLPEKVVKQLHLDHQNTHILLIRTSQ